MTDLHPPCSHCKGPVTRYCVAPGCGQPLVRKHKEQLRDYARRTTCNRACAQRHRAAGQQEQIRKARATMLAKQTSDGPAVTGEVVADFSRFNQEPDDRYGSIPLPPATVVMKQSSIA